MLRVPINLGERVGQRHPLTLFPPDPTRPGLPEKSGWLQPRDMESINIRRDRARSSNRREKSVQNGENFRCKKREEKREREREREKGIKQSEEARTERKREK